MKAEPASIPSTPFKIFTEKRLFNIGFEGIMMLYGGIGSGKSTLINVLAK